VTPQIDSGKTVPTDAQKAAAKKIADQALTDITTGAKKWVDVAKAVSTDSSKATGGDIGWIDKSATEDKAFLDAVFAAAQDKPTAVLVGADGTYRIGRVTEIAPAAVDPAWTTKLTDAGFTVDAYRKVIESEVVRQSLEDKVLADVTKSDKQRDVLEIAIQAPQKPPSAQAIKVRHILFSPNHDPSAASTVAADDPAWTAAKLAAQKAYDDLKKDPSKFDAMARTLSDESSAKGDTGTGGKLPYVDTDGSFVKEFADAVLKDGLKAGDLLEPIKTSFGWHVIQVMYRPPDLDQMKKIRDALAAGGDFATLAKDNSETGEAGKGGAVGWVVKGQLDDRLTAAIFAAPVGGLSDIVEIKGGGTFLFKVLSEKTALPDATQLDLLKSRAFQNWYGQKKDAVTVTRDILTDAGLATP
jgi:parvulin-like peptidyl-prolyl isomerase